MSGKRHAMGCTCGKCGRERGEARAREAVAAETGKRLTQRHVLNLGDRAVEVVSDSPGVWHVVTDGKRGPVLSPDDISGMLEADRENRVRAKARRDTAAGMTARQADEITSALNQDDPAAAIMLELSGPLGLSAAEMERLVPDRAPGTCASCRMPLGPRDGAVRCAWCLALHNLTARPVPARLPAPPPPKLAAPRAVTPGCICKCPSDRAHQVRLGVRPARPARYRLVVPAALLAWAVVAYLGALHVFTPLVIPAVILFLCFLVSLGRRP